MSVVYSFTLPRRRRGLRVARDYAIEAYKGAILLRNSSIGGILSLYIIYYDVQDAGSSIPVRNSGAYPNVVAWRRLRQVVCLSCLEALNFDSHSPAADVCPGFPPPKCKQSSCRLSMDYRRSELRVTTIPRCVKPSWHPRSKIRTMRIQNRTEHSLSRRSEKCFVSR